MCWAHLLAEGLAFRLLAVDWLRCGCGRLGWEGSFFKYHNSEVCHVNRVFLLWSISQRHAILLNGTLLIVDFLSETHFALLMSCMQRSKSFSGLLFSLGFEGEPPWPRLCSSSWVCFSCPEIVRFPACPATLNPELSVSSCHRILNRNRFHPRDKLSLLT